MYWNIGGAMKITSTKYKYKKKLSTQNKISINPTNFIEITETFPSVGRGHMLKYFQYILIIFETSTYYKVLFIVHCIYILLSCSAWITTSASTTYCIVELQWGLINFNLRCIALHKVVVDWDILVTGLQQSMNTP